MPRGGPLVSEPITFANRFLYASSCESESSLKSPLHLEPYGCIEQKSRGAWSDFDRSALRGTDWQVPWEYALPVERNFFCRRLRSQRLNLTYSCSYLNMFEQIVSRLWRPALAVTERYVCFRWSYSACHELSKFLMPGVSQYWHSGILLTCFGKIGDVWATSRRSAKVTANPSIVRPLRRGACWLLRRTASCWQCFYVPNGLGCRAGLPPVRRDGCRTNA
jgi:hypothetical protein